jgi:hypothetical protein
MRTLAQASATAGRWGSGWLSSLVLIVVFVVGFLLVSSVVVVRGRLLDDRLYADALVRSDAYERTYTEVLADPELADLVEELLGGLGVEGVDPVQVRAFSTSALRLAVPPSTVRRGTETFVAAVLAYVRGDVARLDADVDVREVLGRVVDAAVLRVQDVLASAGDRVTTSVDEYRTAVSAFADRLASGVIPDGVPVLEAAGVDPLLLVDVLLARFGPTLDPTRRVQIEAAVLAGDDRDALIDATVGLVTARAADAVTEMRADLENHRDLDVVSEVAERAGRSRAAVIGRLDTVRDAARWFGPGTAVLGGVLMVGAGGGLVWLERRRPRRAAVLLGVAAVAAGCTLVVLWASVIGLVDAPLAPATETGPGSWGLPAGLRALLGDVVSQLADELAWTIGRLALMPIAAGSALVAFLLAAPRLRLPTTPALALGGAVAVVAAAVVGIVPLRSSAAGVRACNGSVELCERAYDEVVQAATHNSMSSPDVVSVWPEQDGDIRAQLDAGIRALLIDTHHWTPLVSAAQLTEGDLVLPPALATQVFDRLDAGRLQGRNGTYLCHNQCALGAIPFVEALVTVREFLEDNPDDVVTLIIQDAISPEETASAFEEAGLDPYLHRHPLGRPWATLDELIDRGERLVVFAENAGPPPDWYHAAFEHMQDTPFRFESLDDLSCAPNRGDSDAPLFLMNHWITRLTPDRATAALANTHDVLVERAQRCKSERGQLPTFVAVDFYGIGDLTAAVATLNGLD